MFVKKTYYSFLRTLLLCHSLSAHVTLCDWCSVCPHSTQIHSWSYWQNSSKFRWCFGQRGRFIAFSAPLSVNLRMETTLVKTGAGVPSALSAFAVTVSTGPVLLLEENFWFMSLKRSPWRWPGLSVSSTDHCGLPSFSTALPMPTPLQDPVLLVICLNCSVISRRVPLMWRSGFLLKFCLQRGHWQCLDESQYLPMQALQKLWPQGVDIGLLNTSKQMEHSSWSSDRKLGENDMAENYRRWENRSKEVKGRNSWRQRLEWSDMLWKSILVVIRTKSQKSVISAVPCKLCFPSGPFPGCIRTGIRTSKVM